MIFIKTITTAVVLINAETVPVIIMNTGISNNNGRVFKFLRTRVKEIMTPLFSRAIAMIIRDNTVIVAEFENPEIASSGVTNPVKARVAIIRKAILSTENISKVKSRMVMRRIEKTSIISKVIIFKKTLRS